MARCLLYSDAHENSFIRWSGKMIKSMIFDRTKIPILNSGLDAQHLRQRSIASNIANVNSPGYQRKVVDFETELQGAVHRHRETLMCTDPKHLSGDQKIHAKPVMRSANDRIDGPGSEEITVEREMAELAQTQIKYETEARLAKQHFDLLKMAIRGIA